MKLSTIILSVALAFLLVGAVSAQDQPENPPPQQQLLDAGQLDQLVAPIALYPDTLLAQVLMASTYPLEVVQADRWANIGFAVVLVSAVYALVLLLTGIFSYPSRSSDMVTIIVVIGVFFGLLLFAFFVIAEVIPHALRRGRRER